MKNLMLITLVALLSVQTGASTINRVKSARVSTVMFNDMATSDDQVVIVLDSESCGACRRAEGLIKQLKNSKVKFYFVPYGSAPADYRTSGATPTFLFFKKGEYLGQAVGSPESVKSLEAGLKRVFALKPKK